MTNQTKTELEQMLDRITAEPAYREQLLNNPQEALDLITKIEANSPECEVVGYAKCRGSCATTCTITCKVTIA